VRGLKVGRSKSRSPDLNHLPYHHPVPNPILAYSTVPHFKDALHFIRRKALLTMISRMLNIHVMIKVAGERGLERLIIERAKEG